MRLSQKEGIHLGRDRLRVFGQLEVEGRDEVRHCDIHLLECKELSNAHATTCAKGHEGIRVTLRYDFLIEIMRIEFLRIVPEVRVMMDGVNRSIAHHLEERVKS